MAAWQVKSFQKSSAQISPVNEHRGLGDEHRRLLPDLNDTLANVQGKLLALYALGLDQLPQIGASLFLWKRGRARQGQASMIEAMPVPMPEDQRGALQL